MSKAKVIRWGIMATGGIAQTFTKDLLIDPSTRGVQDVIHKVAAVASSSSIDSARKFITEMVEPKQPDLHCTAYGAYEELVKDPKVDIVYVASPHSHHYQNCMLCLLSSKPVLCEKALTVNAQQARILYNTAREKNLFFMEAVWTRYFPLSIEIRKLITEGALGEILRVTADLSIDKVPEQDFEVTHRMVNLALAGGALLDLGVYSLTWVFQCLWHTLPEQLRERPKVLGAAMTKEPRTSADEHTSILLEFPKSTPSGKSTSHAFATTSMRLDFDPEKQNHAVPAVRVQGEKGEIQVYGPIYRPTRFKLVLKPNQGKPVQDKHFEFPAGGHGMFWEADAAARGVLGGRLEDDTLPWSESLLVMETMDEVRQKCGLIYPKEIETTEYPVDLKVKT